MKKDLNYFLFKKVVKLKDQEEKKPFYRFQSELAEALVQSPGHYYQNKPENIRPYINQVLKPGDTPYEKPMSEKLKAQILIILRKRLAEEDPLFNVLEEEFTKAYDLLKEKNSGKQEDRIVDNDFEEFSVWSLKANKIVTIIDKPGEAYWSPNNDQRIDVDYILNNFFEIIFKNFDFEGKGLSTIIAGNELKLKPGVNNSNSYTYRFYVSNYAIGILLWQKLTEFLCKEKLAEYGVDEVESVAVATNFLKKVNHFSDGNLSRPMSFVDIYKVDDHITAIPMVYFQSNDGLKIGKAEVSREECFIINLEEEVIKKVFKLAEASLMAWKESVYYYLGNRVGVSKFGVEPIKFEDYEADIINLLDLTDT